MPFSSQTKLAYYLKTHKYHKVGASSERSADVKIVTTTSAELDKLVKKRKFDEHLFNLLTRNLLIIPPLKSRKKDLSSLIDDILEKINQTIHKDIVSVSPEAKGLLLNYDWPGNIRELYNVLERGVMLSKTNILEAEHIFFGLPSAEGKKHFNLLRVNWIAGFFKSRLFPAIFSVPTVLTFLVIVFFAFYSPDRAETNPAVILSWYIGWPFLFLSIFFLGRIWCSICPFSAISRLAQKLFGLEKPVPEFIKTQGHWIMTAFCLVIVWFEEVTDIYSSPLITGFLTLFIFFGALIFALVYSRSVWCRYVCPWGIFNGVLAQSSWVALRSNRDICLTQCKNYNCYFGGDAAPGCPMFGHPYSQDSNRNCIMCGNCIKNCPHQSILLSIRQLPFELWNNSRPLISVSFLCIALALTFLLKNVFDLYYLQSSVDRLHKVDAYYVIFYTASYCATLALSYFILIGNDNLLKEGVKAPGKYFVRNLGYSFIPLALAGYLVYFLKVFSQKSGWLWPAIKYYLYQAPLPRNIPPLVSDKFINHLGSLVISVSIFISLVAANEIINKVDKKRIIPFWKKMVPFSLIILIGVSYLALI